MFNDWETVRSVITIAIAVGGSVGTGWLALERWRATREADDDKSRTEFRGEIRAYAQEVGSRVSLQNVEIAKLQEQVRTLLLENITCLKQNAVLEIKIAHLEAKAGVLTQPPTGLG